MIPSWAATAAAVLAVGTLVQSPRPKMFGNLWTESINVIWAADISIADLRSVIQHSLIVLQGLLVYVKEACSIRKAGVGVERVRGAHWRGHVEQVIGHCHLIVRWTENLFSLDLIQTVSSVSRCWKMASFDSGFTSIRLCLRFTLMPLSQVNGACKQFCIKWH